jgi:hypothetical protein
MFILLHTNTEYEAYIQMVHSFYANNTAVTVRRSKSTKEDFSIPSDISYFLNRKLERETKRLNKGLVQLGKGIRVCSKYSIH